MDNEIINTSGFEDVPGLTSCEKSDNEIIELFNSRDEKAISAAYSKYGRYCTAIAMNILGNRQDAEECLNDTLLKAWESIPPAKPDNLPGYLAKIAKNISLNRYRSSHTEKRGSGSIDSVYEELSECVPDKNSIERSYEHKELIEAINAFLAKLAADKRDIFVLRYWYCMSVSEVAARVGVSENRAAVELFRTRKRLVKHLEKRGF